MTARFIGSTSITAPIDSACLSIHMLEPLERFDPVAACLPAVNSLCSGEERVYHIAAEGPNRKFWTLSQRDACANVLLHGDRND